MPRLWRGGGLADVSRACAAIPRARVANPQGNRLHTTSLPPLAANERDASRKIFSVLPQSLKLQQRVQSGPQQPPQCGADSLLVLNLVRGEPAKTFHHFVGRLVSGDLEQRDSSTLPLAAGPHVSGAPLPPGFRSLNHDPSRSAG